MKKLWKVMATLCVLATVLLLSGCSNGSSEPYTGLYYDLWWVNMPKDDYNNNYWDTSFETKYNLSKSWPTTYKSSFISKTNMERDQIIKYLADEGFNKEDVTEDIDSIKCDYTLFSAWSLWESGGEGKPSKATKDVNYLRISAHN